ncbi:hypothetical protein ACQKWADRAFT_316431 [Trichoderma austrokoningii]
MTSKMTRNKALALIWPLMQRVNRENHNRPNPSDDELETKLTDEIVAMLPPSTKLWLGEWATQANKPIILERLHRCIVEKSALSSETLLDDLFELSEHPQLGRVIARREMKAMVASLRHYLGKNEKGQEPTRDAVIYTINTIEDTISAIKDALAEVQTYAGPTDKASALRNTMNDIKNTIKLAIESLEKVKRNIRRDFAKHSHERASRSQ